jgi:hypothetical protein
LRGSNDEDEAHEKVDGKDVSWLDVSEGHQAASDETIEGIEALSRREDISCLEVSR